MHATGCVVVAALLATIAGSVRAAGRCEFCPLNPYVPDDAVVACRVRRGIIAAVTVFPGTAAYWLLKARARPGREGLVGRLRVRAEANLPLPPVPGLPGRCRDDFCFGRKARFEGTVTPDRQLTGVARYRDGSNCDFAGKLSFAAEPGTVVCRDRSGALLAEGPLDIQLIRLSGCAE